ncbi:putative pyridine nucleotide-disulfide oxidoreductase [Rhexocercosporidium sp. MPI-PUGE-AT-0058]|nr:putative pyridine nucleotide-disulfide oxidoreductase [Rhexocercosporidium sp. MPI-PUGE-AT-0058]
MPIDRTKLSKSLISDPPRIAPRDSAWFKDGSVDVVSDEVMGVDFGSKKVSTKRVSSYSYRKLVLATVGSSKSLPLPGFKELGNIFLLRAITNTKVINAAIGDKGKEISSLEVLLLASPSKSDSSKAGAIELKDGTSLSVDVVILGTENSAITLEKDGSLKTDEYFAVFGLKDVYAISDIATYPYHGPGGNIASHITNPSSVPKSFIPIFWSALGSQLRYCGSTPNGWDDLVHKRKPENAKFIAYYCKGETVVAVGTIGIDPVMVQASELMRRGEMPSKSELKKGVDILTISVPSEITI